MTKIIMRGQVQDGSNHHEIKTNRTSFINVLCKLQRGILIFGGVMFIIWFFITYGSQNYANPSETIIALKRVKGSEMENFQEQILLSGMLQDQVIPIHYNLTLQLFMPPEYDDFTTKGEVNILIECKETTKMIALHARDLTVEDAKITNVKNYQDPPLNVANISQLSEKHLVFFNFEEPLQIGSFYILDINFNGTINNKSAGLYRSDYQLKDSNESIWIASTQFQPSDARRVFPCFDEPGMKSTFEVHIIRKKDTVTLSNMPSIKTETIDDYWELVSFNVTPRMSSYLLAFVVGDVAPYSEERNQGVQIWSRPDMAQFGGYAYKITGLMLKFFSEYFQLPYSMPKTDLVAIPRFTHAAMENWGLITFTESALLYDPERSSTENKVFVTMVIAHELAHQWFGNLVTPTWWDQLWLNEGFASYYEYVLIDAILPEWNIISHFIGTIYEVMESDSLPSTRAMAAPVKADEALLSFDDIAYLKGGAIVYMLQNFLGERTFLRGLRNYMHKYSFENAKEEYLFQNLNLWNKAQIDVQEVMRTWTKQKGYPVITIVRNYSNRFATVTQAAFLSDDFEDTLETTLEEGFSVTGNKDGRLRQRDCKGTYIHNYYMTYAAYVIVGNDQNTMTYAATWIIPVPYTNGKELDWSTKPDYWLKSESGIIKNMPDGDTWFLANIKQVGYYRVNYDVKNWNMLIAQLLENHTVIDPINRAQIINDAMQLARSGALDYHIALNTTQYLSKEEDYLPWQAAFTVFRFLDRRVSNTETYDTWKLFVKMQTSHLYESLGWTNSSADEGILTKYLRKNVLKWNCHYGLEDCVQRAQKLFQDWKNGTTTSNLTMSLDDREVVLCTGIAEGTIQDWEWMWNKYLTEEFKPEKNLLLKSLACTKEIRLLQRLLSLVLKEDGDIPVEDGDEAIVYVADNLYAADLVYDFLKDNSEEILLRFSGVPLTNIIERLTAPLYSPKQIAEMGTILKRRGSTNKAVRRLVKTAMQRAQSNLRWMKHRYDEVNKWLNENVVQQ